MSSSLTSRVRPTTVIKLTTNSNFTNDEFWNSAKLGAAVKRIASSIQNMLQQTMYDQFANSFHSPVVSGWRGGLSESGNGIETGSGSVWEAGKH